MHTNIVYDRISFNSHAGILTRLLTRGLLVDDVLHYIVGACYRKISLRLNSETSKKYFNFFLRQEGFRFKEVPKPNKGDSSAQKRHDNVLLGLLGKLPIKAKLP